MAEALQNKDIQNQKSEIELSLKETAQNGAKKTKENENVFKETQKELIKGNNELFYLGKKGGEKLNNILDGKESNEKSPDKVKERKDILKGLDEKIEKSLQTSVKIESFDELVEKYKKDGEKLENTKNRLREQFLKGEVKEFNKTNVDKDGKTIPSKREKLLKEEPFLKNLDGKLLDEAAVIYGEETMKNLSSFLEKLEGKKFPQNLEELNLFIDMQAAKKEIEELKKEDSNYNPNENEVLKRIQKARSENPNYLKSALTNYSNSGKSYNFDKGPNIENNALLDKAIDSLPEGQTKRMLEDAKQYMGLNENNPADNQKLTDLLGFDPAKTPWCKGFINAIAKKNGIDLNSAGNLAALSGQADGRKLNLPGEKPMPGDIVVMGRKGGGHIGIFLGMSSSGNPIILGGNQWNSKTKKSEIVSIKEVNQSRNPIVSINRIVSQEEEAKNKEYMEKNKK